MAAFTTEQLESIAGASGAGVSLLSSSAGFSTEDLLEAGITYRGPFEFTPITLAAPQPGIGFITLWDVFAVDGPYKYSSFEPTDGANAYHGRLVGNISMVKEQADIFNGLMGARQAQLEISNLNTNPEAPTLSELKATQEVHSLFAPVQLYDLASQTTLFRLNGKITSFTPRRRTASATIAVNEPTVFEQKLPRLRVVDAFPAADLASTRIQDPVVLVAFGPWRKVQLTMCQTDLSTYWDYGPLRKATTGEASYVNLYREGALIDPAEYTIVEPSPGYLLARFTLDQNDTSGRALSIQADITSTEFNQNPAAIIRFLLENPTYGLGQIIDTASFTEAIADFASIPMRVGNGLSQQLIAKSILPHLLLHGAVLDRNDDGEYTLTVDTLAKHPQHADADLQLGAGLEDWNNISNEPEGSLRDETQRLNELIIQAAFDPYFDNKGSYYIRSRRARDVGGISRTIESPFLVDVPSADRQTHYLWIKNNGRDEQYALETIAETYVLDLGHLVKVTVDTLLLNETVMEVTRKSFKGGNELAFGYIVAGWDPTAYSYVYNAANLQVSPYADVLTDYRRTPPATPTNFAVTGSVRYAESSLVESMANLSCDAPTVNVTHIGYILFEAGSHAEINFIEVECTPGQVGVTGGFVVDAALEYDIDYYAINKNNDPDRQESIHGVFLGFTAAGDSADPAPPTTLYAYRGTGRTVYLEMVASVDAAKVRAYEFQRDPDPTFAAPLSWQEKTTKTADTNVPYDGDVYYRARAIARSGRLSAWSNVAVMHIVRLQPSDYGQDTMYRYHQAPQSSIVYIVTVPANTSYTFDSGIDSSKQQWHCGALGIPQATPSWSGGTPPDGTRLLQFVVSGGIASGTFSNDFDIGIWNGVAEDLDPTVVRTFGS